MEFTTSFEEIRERVFSPANTRASMPFPGPPARRGGEKAVAKAMLKSSKALAAEEGGNDVAPKAMMWW